MFQVGLKQLGERVLLSCPTYKDVNALPLFIPGELTTVRWGFAPAISAYCSKPSGVDNVVSTALPQPEAPWRRAGRLRLCSQPFA